MEAILGRPRTIDTLCRNIITHKRGQPLEASDRKSHDVAYSARSQVHKPNCSSFAPAGVKR
jgi:hypothetical protein